MAIKECSVLAESDFSVETLNRLGAAVRAVRHKGRLDDLKDLEKEYGENALLLRSIGVALPAYRESLRLNPRFAQAVNNLGRSYMGLDMLENGIKELKLYLKYFDKSVLAAGVPQPSVVKDEIKLLEDMVEEKHKGEARG